MPLKLTCGVSKKVGLPHYSSLGASCHIELELDASLLFADLDAFHRQVQSAYTVCTDAVGHELARQQESVLDQHRVTAIESRSNGTSDGDQGSHGNGHCASPRQLAYAQQLARQIHELGEGGLDELANKMFGRPLAELTSLEASSLIDTLKDIRDGRLSIDVALCDATS